MLRSLLKAKLLSSKIFENKRLTMVTIMESQHLQRLWPLYVKGTSLRLLLAQMPAGTLPHLTCFIKGGTFLRLIPNPSKKLIKFRIFFLIEVQIILNRFRSFCFHVYAGQLTIHLANWLILIYMHVNEITTTHFGKVIEV